MSLRIYKMHNRLNSGGAPSVKGLTYIFGIPHDPYALPERSMIQYVYAVSSINQSVKLGSAPGLEDVMLETDFEAGVGQWLPGFLVQSNNLLISDNCTPGGTLTVLFLYIDLPF